MPCQVLLASGRAGHREHATRRPGLATPGSRRVPNKNSESGEKSRVLRFTAMMPPAWVFPQGLPASQTRGDYVDVDSDDSVGQYQGDLRVKEVRL